MGCSVPPVYTVTDESRYLIVKNVPALGCAEELVKLFGSYGPIEEYRIMDEEESEPFTDIYWIKFLNISNARFAKRKVDNVSFLGNLLEVTYAPMYETLSDTKDKLEERQNAILRRIRCPGAEKHGQLKRFARDEGSAGAIMQGSQPLLVYPGHLSHAGSMHASRTFEQDYQLQSTRALMDPTTHVQIQSQSITSSMNATVHAVREKLDHISSVGLGSEVKPPESSILRKESVEQQQEPVEKKARTDNRRRI